MSSSSQSSLLDDRKPIHFIAPKPSYSWAEWLSWARPDRLILRLIGFCLQIALFIPRLLLWALAKALAWTGLKTLPKILLGIVHGLGSIVFLAQVVRDEDNGWKQRLNPDDTSLSIPLSESKKRFPIKTGTVYTQDGAGLGASLETVEIEHPENKDKKISDRHYVIKFSGGLTLIQDYLTPEHVPVLAKEMEDKKASIVLFNNRGVAGSTGSFWNAFGAGSIDHLFIDDIAQIERILNDNDYKKQGDPYPLIFLDTFSLGGARAARVVKHFHDKGIKIFLEDNMSPASIADYVTCHLFPHFHKPKRSFTGILTQILAYGVWLILKLLLRLSGWEVDTAHYYTAIPGGEGKYRRHRIYRSPKADRGTEKERQAGDFSVLYGASLHKAPLVQQERRREKEENKRQADNYKKKTVWRSKIVLNVEKYSLAPTPAERFDAHRAPCEIIAPEFIKKWTTQPQFPFRPFVLQTRNGAGLYEDSLDYFKEAAQTHQSDLKSR